MLMLLFSGCIFVSCLYIVEFFLRWSDPRTRLHPGGMYGHINGQNYTWGKPVFYNKYKFREKDFETPKPVETWRIMVLGDSLTFGAGLSYDERYSYLLQQCLNKKGGQKKVEILNFGVPGASTSRERNILKEYLNVVQPDLILVGFCFNDPQPREMDYSPELESFEKKYLPLMESIYQFLLRFHLPQTGKLIKRSIYGVAQKMNVIPTWQEALGRAYVESSPEWKEFQTALRDIKQLSDDRGLPAPIFAVMNQGTRAGRPIDYNRPDANLKLFLTWFHQAEKAAADSGLITVQFEKEIARELHGEVLSVNSVDLHPSSRLNRLYAEKLCAVIERYVDNPAR